jgi:4-hydroxybenzoate polyprenyltransferase
LDGRSEVSWVVFLATLALYNLDGSLDAPQRGHSRQRTRAHIVLTALSCLLCLGFALTLPARARAFLGFGMLTCASYALPLGRRRVALKEIPYLKAAFVGSSVAGATVGLPLLGSAPSPGGIPWTATCWLFGVIAIGCSHNAILFDVADFKEDRRKRVATVPRIVGLRSTRRFCVALLICGLGATALAPPQIPPLAKLGLLALWIALGVGTFTVNPRTRKATVALAIDGALIFPWAVITLGP